MASIFPFFSYYLELLQQEYAGAASFNIAMFKEKSSFTEDQTDDAVNEVQNIVAEYDVFNEEYVRSLVAKVLALIHYDHIPRVLNFASHHILRKIDG